MYCESSGIVRPAIVMNIKLHNMVKISSILCMERNKWSSLKYKIGAISLKCFDN